MLKSDIHRNTYVAVRKKQVFFDEKGETTELSEEEEKSLARFDDFYIVNENGQVEEPEVEEEVEEEELDAYEQVLKGTTKTIEEQTKDISPDEAMEYIRKEQEGQNRKGVISHFEKLLFDESEEGEE